MSGRLLAGILLLHSRPRYNERPIRTGKTKFHYIEVLLIHMVCYYWGKEQLSLYRSTLYRGSTLNR